MQHLDHDMDDLFRKAAENYPLKTGEGDWDLLAAKMLLVPPAPIASKKKGIKYYGLLLFALLLFIVLGGLHYYAPVKNKVRQKSEDLSSTLSKDPTSLGRQAFPRIDPLNTGKNSLLSETVNLGEENVFSDNKVKAGANRDESILTGKENAVSKKTGHYKHYIINNRDTYLPNSPQARGPSVPVQPELEICLESSLIKGIPVTPLYSINGPLLKQEPIKIAAYSSQKRDGFYLALNGGPEFTKIGSQSNTKSGYQAGVLIGYKLNTRWSIESGLMMGTDNYYSDGRYFDMSRVASSMPAGMQILSVDGQSKHLQIPLVAKYNFLHRQRSDFFFTGGVLSDLYMQEKNYYHTMLNGVKDNQMGIYNPHQLSLASQVRISIGYEHPLGRSGSFRIEPYKNIPLQKTGMGSMSVFSSGVNVGLVHYFRK